MYASAAYPTYPTARYRPTLRPFGGDANILLVQDEDEYGYPAYYFLRVNVRQKELLKREAEKQLPLDLARFGEVLYSAYGREPSEQALAFLRERYGWNG